MYVKDDDPNGNKVETLSCVLRQTGINSDTDIYHSNDNIQDWSFWVNESIEQCVEAGNGYVLLICSRAMFTVLEKTADNVRVQMVYGHIDRITLRRHIVSNTKSFLPIFISDFPDLDPQYVPSSLSAKTSYHFPYELMNKMPDHFTVEEMLDDKQFTSMRSLIATLTGQPEYHVPDIGKGV